MGKFSQFLRVIVGLAVSSGASAQPQYFIQKDISAANIVETGSGYTLDIAILASDFEEMFMKAADERRGMDLSGPGILELEIGRFVARRVTMRDREGKPCANKLVHAGEDPTNDEAVLVSLAFDCVNRDVVYDASKFLAAQGARAWQAVRIDSGAARREAVINADSPPLQMALAK